MGGSPSRPEKCDLHSLPKVDGNTKYCIRVINRAVPYNFANFNFLSRNVIGHKYIEVLTPECHFSLGLMLDGDGSYGHKETMGVYLIAQDLQEFVCQSEYKKGKEQGNWHVERFTCGSMVVGPNGDVMGEQLTPYTNMNEAQAMLINFFIEAGSNETMDIGDITMKHKLLRLPYSFYGYAHYARENQRDYCLRQSNCRMFADQFDIEPQTLLKELFRPPRSRM